eukprot:1138569-Pelagomonas_calceolata.AAC.4
MMERWSQQDFSNESRGPEIEWTFFWCCACWPATAAFHLGCRYRSVTGRCSFIQAATRALGVRSTLHQAKRLIQLSSKDCLKSVEQSGCSVLQSREESTADENETNSAFEKSMLQDQLSSRDMGLKTWAVLQMFSPHSHLIIAIQQPHQKT